jgi:hypothetical protein
LPTSISTLHFLPKNLSPEEELPKGSWTITFIIVVFKWDVPEATKHQTSNSRTTYASIVALPQLVQTQPHVRVLCWCCRTQHSYQQCLQEEAHAIN